MTKNDYRRQLIMLRGLEKGYAGHARLEKRVLTGTMDFVVSASQSDEPLEAAFVGIRGGKTRVTPLGELRRDSRGRRALLAEFDPRNLSGMDLNEIAAAVISRRRDDQKEPVMYGCINGACRLDWQNIRGALNEGGSASYKAPSSLKPDEAPDENYAGEKSVQKIPDEAAAQEITSAAPSAEEAFSQPANAPSDIESALPSGQPIEAGDNQATLDAGLSAASRLEIDMTKPWPENIESLRLLFLTLPAYDPFPADGFVFIRAGMAAETGLDHCAVGVRAENGKIAQVMYALPMPYSPQPPAGLEEYRWVGDKRNGWWITTETISE